MKLIEVQIDRLVGPTHHFGGLGVGNVASLQHAGQVSNPAAAALQGLDKMRVIAELGVPQFILPPQPRPDLEFLRSLGFAGPDFDTLSHAWKEAPGLLSAAQSCSAMWTANAATVTPAVDGQRSSIALTIANLSASIHRAIEPPQTMTDLRNLLPPTSQFFEPLRGGAAMRDEGAANHMRLGSGRNEPGVNVFVHGVFVHGDGTPTPQQHWPRQTLAACQAIARQHRLPPERTLFLQQHPDAIDAGAFHNDVVALSHHNLLIYHELAFTAESEQKLQLLETQFPDLVGERLVRKVVTREQLSLKDAVRTYLFNSQVVSAGRDGLPHRILLCPTQVATHSDAKAIVNRWCEEELFDEVKYVELNQSMDGGGGPACLRLRVPVPESELASLPQACRWSERLDAELRETIHKQYSTSVSLDLLSSVDFCNQARHARNEIARLLG